MDNRPTSNIPHLVSRTRDGDIQSVGAYSNCGDQSDSVIDTTDANLARDRESSITDNSSSNRVLQSIDNTHWLVEQAIGIQEPDVTIIIPVFNEIKTLRQVVDAVTALEVSKQIILVDDGSVDGSRDLVQSLDGKCGIQACLHEKNRGKGAAIQSGISLARGKVVIVQDADLEYNPADILMVIRPILQRDCDVVYGSRYLANTHQDASWIHRFGNKILTDCSNFATGQKLTDMETCYKAFRREVIQSIRIEQNRFGFEPEITAKLARRKIPIRELPISYVPRSWKQGKKIGVKDLMNTLWCIVWYRFAPQSR